MLWISPFILILLSIALIPLVQPHFWEKNTNKALVCWGLALPVGVYLLKTNPTALWHTAHEYTSFIILLGSLFVISGGINLKGDIQATPKINTLFLAVGAVLANIVGTTGASMLLIRPLLRTNQERKITTHLPLFFIFIVSNIGGLLTPIGDPPLFLGFLRGVPFLWTLKLFPIWILSNTILLIVFYFFDSKAYAHETKSAIKADKTNIDPLSLKGKLNLFFLALVVASVFAPTPYREGIMVLVAMASYRTTHKSIHQDNRFGFGPIIEVAVIFAGIFIAMVPALEFLSIHGQTLGIEKPFQFYWLSGMLSSFLDNAPTYLTFFSLAQSLPENLPAIAGVNEKLLMAISAGSVMMGANSYIGNGPNFMVKAIADEMGIKTPSFFGYMLYSGSILIPLFILVTFIFFA